MKKVEYLLCAALWYNDDKKYEHQPNNIESGVVFCGRRHHNCFILLSLAFPDKNKKEVSQGFLTSFDRYVDRKEGAEIALKSGQIIDATNCLFSEDLY